MSTFTCISCRVAFEASDLQRLHYKTDWHRYNLKRKVSELPPVTCEEFQCRVLQQRVKKLNGEVRNKSIYCRVCRRNFSNPKAYDNHVNSKKHKENEINYVPSEGGDSRKNSELVEAEEVEEVDSDEWEDENPIESNNCLFCLRHSRDLVNNLQHMMKAHTFFVPDIEYCVDLPGLLLYLGEKVSKDYLCLWCNDKGKSFHTADAARSHMLDKGHCKMLHEGLALAEYSDFYDYSASYPDAEEVTNPDEEVDIPEIDGTDYQLVLPSGVIVGHRSLMRYYKQKLNPHMALQPSKSNKRLHKVLAEYRSLGWTETQQEAAARKARDLHYMKRLQSKWSLKLGKQSNRTKQPHFRTQINF